MICFTFNYVVTKMRRSLLIVAMTLITSFVFGRTTNVTGLRTTVYSKGMNGYSTFRIPAIVRTNNNTLLAFAEARRNGRSDTGNIDRVVRRSEDGGATWSNLIVVWDDADNTCGNPSPIVDKESGRIILLMTWNRGDDRERTIMRGKSHDTRRVFICYSDDDGRKWSTPQEITASTKCNGWAWYATGPCHAIQLQHKSHRGRIVVPCNHSLYEGGRTYYNAHLIYSDDRGTTWNIGATLKGGNESTVAELANGSIMHNTRWQRGADKYARHYAISHDGGLTSGEVVRDSNLIEPVCQGSIIGYSTKGRATNHLLFCNPASMLSRKRLTLRQSRNGGKSWSRGTILEEGPSAYSDIVVMPRKQVGVLFECGKKSPYERIDFRLLNKREIN